jgi:hypothetical protein
MSKSSKKVLDRIASELKRFQPILSSAKARDVNESDTVTIIVDLLQYLFGYDKYSEITSEHAIRGTYCDLAIKVEGALCFLIEVKSIGTDLRDSHVKQGVDYAANQGVDWVILTNGTVWRVFKVGFEKPITAEEVLTVDLLTINPKDNDAVQLLALLAKEGWEKSHLDSHHAHKKVLNRYVLGAVVMSEPVVDSIRRELRRISGDGKFTEDEVRRTLSSDVIKRDVLEDSRASDAQKMVSRAAKKVIRKVQAEVSSQQGESSPHAEEPMNTGSE